MSDIYAQFLNDAKSWPFIEARKIIKRINNKTPKKGYVLFQTGYGPSGLPHIGTFGEVARTTMVKKAFERLTNDEIPTKLFCFSDDLDGLRKVPTNVPNQELLAQYLKMPLTKVPDPFGTHDSFGGHNNARLCSFLDKYGFDYEFLSSTQVYASGKFDEMLLKILRHYDEIMQVILPTLGLTGGNRKETYSPFLPISPKSGKVLEVPMQSIDAENGTITFIDEDGEETTIPVTGGNVKLQWKVDWAMRWAALDVDYEMCGKDLIDSVNLGNQICKVLKHKPPLNMVYEMFLDDEGKKISKSKGNGISMEEWLKYAPSDSLAYYMFLKPQTAKRLHFDIIPKTVDEWLQQLVAFPKQEAKQKLDNPVFHIYGGEVPIIDCPITFNLMLNLASVVHADNKEILWDFITKYLPDASKETYPIIDHLAEYATAYYQDKVKPNISYKVADDKEKEALLELKTEIEKLAKDSTGEEVQKVVYAIGKKYEYEPLKDWFKLLYEVLLGQSSGPRMGSFFALYGLDNSIKLLQKVVDGQEL